MNKINLLDFRQSGFCIITNVISSELLGRLRANLDACQFKNPGVGLGISRVIQLPELEQFIFAPEIVATLREILGVELSIFPNITVRSNTQAPWHLDEAFRKPSPGWEDISQCDFVQAMIYLQDNGLQGGGLDVVPGSHRLNQLGRALGSIHAVIQFLLAHKQTVMSKSGDCIIWDNRLLHRSTQNLIEGRKNYGLQWTIAKRAADKKRFLQHLRSRGRDKEDFIGVDRRYSEIETFGFVRHASKPFQQAALGANIELFDIERQKLNIEAGV